MKIKTAELTGAALDWVVAKCEGEEYRDRMEWDGIGQDYPAHKYSTDWSQGGPIIEREEILFVGSTGKYSAWLSNRSIFDFNYQSPTHLIAAMRCWVTFKLGDEVDIPAELVQSNPI